MRGRRDRCYEAMRCGAVRHELKRDEQGEVCVQGTNSRGDWVRVWALCGGGFDSRYGIQNWYLPLRQCDVRHVQGVMLGRLVACGKRGLVRDSVEYVSTLAHVMYRSLLTDVGGRVAR
jgi:hypothetical protein